MIFPPILQISVFRSKTSIRGVVLRGYGSEVIQVSAKKSDSYEILLKKIKEGLALPRKGKKLSLYKFSGERIINSPISLMGRKYEWTLRNYLLVCKKSPSQVKIGVAHVHDVKV